MEENRVCFKEVVQLFVHDIVPFIKGEYEVPSVDFVFKREAFVLFEEVKNEPFVMKNCYIPKIEDRDIVNLSVEYDNTTPVVMVHDHVLFFEYLTNITNQLLDLYKKYHISSSARYLCIAILKRIWLRMGPSDFLEVEEFLRRQLEFIKDDTFLELRNEKISEVYGCDIYASAQLNHTYDESTRKMAFRMDKKSTYHDLPEIFYDIMDTTEEKICYIYAIQNSRNRKIDKKISRLLYKLNSGILNLESDEYLEYKNGMNTYYPENISDVSLGHVLSLLLFIDLLKSYGIYKIRVPMLQVLSYDYHVLLSEKAEENFSSKWNQEKLEEVYGLKNLDLKNRMIQEYLFEKMWYDHVVDKEDFISQNKTEVLYRIFRRVSYHDQNIMIRNDAMMEGDYFDIRLNLSKMKVKKQFDRTCK